ncbi:zinc-binding dehydrogenase, partial [Rheinheimera sp.]|uniref:zinc-binding dehydrogenase n=1 Tax=Rheinheimera sp. TaxID=1869214 RepID=UPI003AF7C568
MIQQLRAPLPQQALAEAETLLDKAPHKALDQAEALLRRMPGFGPAELLAARALRRMGKGRQALTKLDALARGGGAVPVVLWELGQAAAEAGDVPRAIAALQALVQAQPGVAGGWFLLARQLRKAGRAEEAWRADLSGVHASSRDAGLLKAAVAVQDGDLAGAAALLGERLARQPGDPPALRLHGEIAWRLGEMTPAIERVERAVALAPGFDLARDFLIRLLLQTNRLAEALDHAEVLQHSPVPSSGHKLILASVLVRLGHQERAAALYRQLLDLDADQPQVWQNLGHVLKTLGRQGEAVEAYRAAVSRQPTMGEAFVVSGLGLIGLMAVQLLLANGCRVLGVDTNPDRLELARSFGAETCDLSTGKDPVAAAEVFSRGRGVDGVLLTLASSSDEPVSQAARMCRKRGRVVLVGVTGLKLNRSDFFEKEISFQVSCSYGPGRYDPTYEEKGQDYPIGFVRWTEQRNFEAVLDQLASGALNVAPLISHRIPIAEAARAYDMLATGDSGLGLLLDYQDATASTRGQESGATIDLGA